MKNLSVESMSYFTLLEYMDFLLGLFLGRGEVCYKGAVMGHQSLVLTL